MAQQDNNPAQGLIGDFEKVANFFKGTPKTPPPSKPDTSWHDDMVRKANESFQKKAPVGKKRIPQSNVRTAPLANKRVPRKKTR